MSFISQISVVTDQFSMAGQDCLQLVDTTFYLFGVTWPSGNTSTPTIQALKSTDDGVTWTHVAYGPQVKRYASGNVASSCIACVKDGTLIRIFFCNSSGVSSVTGLTGLLAEIDFDTTLNVFSGGAVSDFNPFLYTFDGSVYAEGSPNSFSHIIARRNSSDLYRLIFLNEFNTVTPVSTRATTTFNGASFSTTKNPITLGSSYPGILVGGLIDQSTNTFTVLFQDLSSVPFQGVLNLDGTITRLQDFGFNDVTLSKFAYIDSNKAYFNWSVRTTASDFPSLLVGASNSDPVSLVQEDGDSSLPVGNTYIQNPQTAIFNNGGDCRCSFFFAKKVGATEMHLLKSFRSASGFWFTYTIEATFSDATVGVDTNSLDANYVGVFHGGNKFSMVAGGNRMTATFGTPAAFPIYFARGDITFHSSCSSIVILGVTVDDSFGMSDAPPSTFLGTVGGGTQVHSCPDVVVASSFCSDIKTPNDGETSLHDCEERLYTENTQPCLETLV